MLMAQQMMNKPVLPELKRERSHIEATRAESD
jgi:hypothetical protein